MNIRANSTITPNERKYAIVFFIIGILVAASVSVTVYSVYAPKHIKEAERIAELEDAIEILVMERTTYIELSFAEIQRLRAENAELEMEYSVLNSKYESLKEDYDELSLITEERKPKNESTIYVTENESLEVISKLVPCFTDNKLISYIIRVNATNISDKPLDKVCVFMVAYAYDETTGGSWSCTAGSLNTESLYPQETYTCEFTDLFKEITTYKIFAVVTGV